MSSQLPEHNEASLPPQEILDLFKRTFDDELYGNDDEEETGLEKLQSQIQEVKSHLYDRDYIGAFDNDIKRVAYCCRWSPARALGYASLFSHFEPIKDILTCNEQEDKSVLCVGGGAGAELVSIASIFTPSRPFMSKYSKKNNDETTTSNGKLNLHLVDIAEWNHVTERLLKQIETHWLYANEFESFNVNCELNDVLTMNSQALQLNKLDLITLLFTTNELFKEQKAGSIRFLQNLNKNCQKGCLLLIVESAGSYSHITVGTKKFPLQFLIDTILCGQRGEESKGDWEIIDQNDSMWYRCGTRLDYPIKLENMRVFYRLYRKKN
ncbi:similar to Saccharomyces cerevisiae YLR063W BMT6 Putative S-adenosylmethionine-dependent methyltransferase [Maudiozyma saulgeensis]|uniref:Similar to Saccharomyces cerevisiae YLR063W BMT6 Putative S-adenosylmethionine-dependent methyltransferase n=1 Tax=Maudiozyma saulgeensis TaxID=1789683 RepID=A0A1X7R341_9SACH|nr:similar to Saccharomyces cerevisiae YLR063W BMT6 Putative S-adenosylmethionine-dependent methyltransferase [Kazachstania saulgeensis]